MTSNDDKQILKYAAFRFTAKRGMTLIEVIIYVTLLSFLLSGFIQYAYGINIDNFKLMDEINAANIQ